jgi:cell division protein FtsB
MRIVTYGLVALLVLLQYPLWFGSGGVLAYWRLHREVQEQIAKNAELRERNLTLQAEVVNLKSGLDAIEERAREELGMVRPNETFVRVVEGDQGKGGAPKDSADSDAP